MSGIQSLLPDSLHALPKVDLFRRLGGAHTFGAGSESHLPEWASHRPRSRRAWEKQLGDNEGRLAALGGLQEAVHAELDAARDDNVAHVELVVSPVAIAGALGSMERSLNALTGVVEAEPPDGGPSLGWLVKLSAGESPDDVTKVVEWAHAIHAAGVAGLVVELAADDPADADKRLANSAAEGLPLMVQLAEDTPPDSIVERLDILAPARIAFGSPLIRSLDAINWIRRHRPALVVCFSAEPPSEAGPKLSSHPMIAMIQAGMQVSLATWAPGPLHTTLTSEYRLVGERLGLTLETLRALSLAGVQASFLPERQKRRMERAFEDAIFGFPAEA